MWNPSEVDVVLPSPTQITPTEEAKLKNAVNFHFPTSHLNFFTARAYLDHAQTAGPAPGTIFTGLSRRDVPSLFAVDGYYPQLDSKVHSIITQKGEKGVAKFYAVWVTDGVMPLDKDAWKLDMDFVAVADEVEAAGWLRNGKVLAGMGVGVVVVLFLVIFLPVYVMLIKRDWDVGGIS
eukprot:TRINITY_DN7971_c0_g1_i1.p1 TRINITY_DN7971_c0_g1~~TRINITY_DN7971_c0_g1_i1.p1  ORF type:complete len:178 (+),score=31.43 TRINITY_DN7971_c0_g1_i1:67-600(+)